MNYNAFINSKSKMSESHGFVIDAGMVRFWFRIPKMFGDETKYRRIRNELAKLPQYDFCWTIR